MGISQVLAEEVYRTKLEDIPKKTVERVKQMILDHVGIVYMGYNALGKELAAYAKDVGGNGEAVIIGGKIKTSCELAASINAQMAKDTNFEDAGPGAHPGPAVVHTALAVGQKVHASGKDVITTACLGYEMNCRFHYARRNPNIPLQRHIPVIVTMEAAKLLGLTPAQTSTAMGISVRWVQQRQPFRYKQISYLGYGNLMLCRHGIQSALLARHGYNELPDYLDEYKNEWDFDKLASSPAPYQYTFDEIELKPWTASRFCNGALQLIAEIIKENNLKPEEIDKITFKAPNIYLQPHQYEQDPRDYWEALYSTHWGMTMTALGYEPGPGWVTRERIEEKRSRDFLKRVAIVEDTEATDIYNKGNYLETPNTIELESKGRKFTKKILMGDVLGSSRNPMPPEMLEGKFLRLAKPALGEGQAAKLLAKLKSIEDVKDINEVAKLF